MNIIVCGAGRVGFSIAKQLSAQSHSITMIDQSSDDIQKVKNGDQVKIENGYTTEFRGEVQLNKSRNGKMDVTPS